MDNFIEDNRAVNVQANREIETVESSLNKELIKNWTSCRNPSQSSPISLIIKGKKMQRMSGLEQF